MVGRPPSACRTDIVADCCVFLPLIWNIEDVRNWRHTATSRTARSPGIGLPCDDGAVLFCTYLHTGVRGRPGSSDREFRITLEHDADRLASTLFRDFGGKDSPAIRRELAAEASANVVLMNTNIGGGNLQRFCHLAGNARNILRGDVGKQVILILSLIHI